ncbi:hypothetical protein KCU81_g6212, partial [Aureobasidium melanogenum]|uniref:Uncharacterized protein n=1 Tax=Aureobasidium melanogenum (strain CBS 110374) TaxID=1043003 RepID=A0A074VND5_AURM1
MPFVRQNHINSVRPPFIVRPATVCLWANGVHTSSDARAILLSNHPELSDQKARKRVVYQYYDRCATLGVSQSTRIQNFRLHGLQLEHFIRLKLDATAALILEDESSRKLSKQYRECDAWLKNNAPKAENMYEAERNAVLARYPKLATAAVREAILNQYEVESEKVLVPRSEKAESDQAREFAADVSHDEKRHFCELALQYVVIHLIDNPITTEDALGKWKADYKQCQDTLAKILLITTKEEKAEVLKEYPDLEDLDVCRRTINEHDKLRKTLIEREEQGIKISSKEYEESLRSTLKALAATVFLPGGDNVERRNTRRKQREALLAEMNVNRAASKKGGGFWIIPDPTWIGECIGFI